MDGLFDLEQSNLELLQSVQRQLLHLRRRREELLSRRRAIGGIISELGSESNVGPADNYVGYIAERHLANDASTDDVSTFYADALTGDMPILLSNLNKPVRHVLDPFSDAFVGLSSSTKGGRRLVQGQGPENADQKELSALTRYFPLPGRRVQWSPALDAMLISLVSTLGLSDDNGVTGADFMLAGHWGHIAEELERFQSANNSSRSDSAGTANVCISGGCCSARWFQVLLPLATFNASVRVPLSADAYTAVSSSAWSQKADEVIVEAVVGANGVTGRLFWMDLARHPHLLHHSPFSLLCRFQVALNPLLCSERGAKALRDRYVAAMGKGGLELSSSCLSTKRQRPGAPSAQQLFSSLLCSSDLTSQFNSYVAESYADARRLGLGPPTLVLSPQSTIPLMTREQLRSKLRYASSE